VIFSIDTAQTIKMLVQKLASKKTDAKTFISGRKLIEATALS